MRTRSVIVIGGGLAGIAASLALAREGLKVRLLETKRRLGGRVGSYTNQLTGETVDYCQHVGMKCCSNLERLIDWLGHQQYWQVQPELHFYGPTGDYQRLAAWPLPAPLHLVHWLVRWPGLSTRDRISVAKSLWKVQQQRPSDLSGTSALQWLQESGQSTRCIDHFWKTIINSALGEHVNQVNMGAVCKVIQDGFLRKRNAFHLLVPRRPLGELFGTLALEKLKSAGVEVILEANLQRLVALPPNSADALQYEVHYTSQQTTAQPVTSSNSDALAQVDGIVIAVPWHRLSAIAANFEGGCESRLQQIANQANQLKSSPITGVHTWWDRAWLPTSHAAIVGRTCQWVFPKHDEPVVSSRLNQFYYQIVISAQSDLPRGDEAAEVIHRDLSFVFPTVREARLTSCQVVTDPKAVFSISPESQSLRPDPELAPGMVLAGDWVATGWPATMEGAILSGFQASELILNQLREAEPQRQCVPRQEPGNE